mmetsp:Transcript_16487/g.26118  ORF Transcript_16487/g.26118 Transcript_16487/m.26118 type:complete len:344 (-) Transcript_16487:658-1689(-)
MRILLQSARCHRILLFFVITCSIHLFFLLHIAMSLTLFFLLLFLLRLAALFAFAFTVVFFAFSFAFTFIASVLLFAFTFSLILGTRFHSVLHLVFAFTARRTFRFSIQSTFIFAIHVAFAFTLCRRLRCTLPFCFCFPFGLSFILGLAQHIILQTIAFQKLHILRGIANLQRTHRHSRFVGSSSSALLLAARRRRAAMLGKPSRRRLCIPFMVRFLRSRRHSTEQLLDALHFAQSVQQIQHFERAGLNHLICRRQRILQAALHRIKHLRRYLVAIARVAFLAQRTMYKRPRLLLDRLVLVGGAGAHKLVEHDDQLLLVVQRNLAQHQSHHAVHLSHRLLLCRL